MLLESSIDLVIGVSMLIGAALLMWFSTRNCRAARRGFWSVDGTAYTMSIAVVLIVIVATAWTIKASLLVIPHQVTAIAFGLLIVAAVLFGAFRLMGTQPE